MQKLLEYIVKNIVQNTDDVVITESEITNEDATRQYTTYYISVNTDDIGIVIGKEGKTIKSIRNILKVKAIKEGKYIDVRIKDDSEAPEII